MIVEYGSHVRRFRDLLLWWGVRVGEQLCDSLLLQRNSLYDESKSIVRACSSIFKP